MTDPDGLIDGIDILRIATAFGSSPGDPRYDAAANMDEFPLIDGLDLAFVASGFGDTCP